MTLWLSSDLHLGHEKISEYAGRPYENVDDMNGDIKCFWNSIIDSDDTVIILGDIVMGKVGETLPLIKELNGEKFLVAGNHDRWTKPYIKDPQKDPAETGFTAIYEGPIPIQIGPYNVLGCHYPYEADERHGEKYKDRRPEDKGQWLLHGHTHGLWKVKGRQIDVGLDAWGGLPVSENELADLISEGPQNLPREQWGT